MISNLNSKTATELYKILSFLNKKDLEKIPKEEREYIEKLKDNTMTSKINNVSDIRIEKIDEETKGYLAYIFLNYLASEEEKAEYINIINENEARFQKELSEKYDIQKKFNDIKNKKTCNQEVALQVVREKNIFQKIFDKLKEMFSRK